MKHLLKLFFAAIALTGVMSSCGGGNENETPTPPTFTDPLVLTADKTTFTADGEDVVTFTVKQGGVDVTEDCSICCQALCLADNKYSTTDPDVYTFYAYFSIEANDPNRLESNTLEITATSAEAEPGDLVLTADKTTIKADGKEAITFTVTQDGSNVTDLCSICMTSGLCLSSEVFTSEDPGNYTFYAYYTADAANPNKKESNKVNVTVSEVEVTKPKPTGPVLSNTFSSTRELWKNVIYFIFTHNHCGPCFTLKNNLYALDNKDHIIEAYCYTEQSDAFIESPPGMLMHVQGSSNGRFSISSFPTTIIELNKDGGYHVGAVSTETLKGAYDKFIGKAARTGIKVASKIENGNINFTVTVGAQVANTYYLGVQLIEDNIVGYQEGYGDGYNHMNVIRAQASRSFYGDELGHLPKGETSIKSYSFPVLSNYKTENLSLLLYTMTRELSGYYIVNSVKVPVNGNTGYQYVK